jgi:hypothetical protein
VLVRPHYLTHDDALVPYNGRVTLLNATLETITRVAHPDSANGAGA